jgi:hypothetical protein
MRDTRSEEECKQLLQECHLLVARLGQSPYSIKLLKAARSALLLTAGYKAHRQTKD